MANLKLALKVKIACCGLMVYHHCRQASPSAAQALTSELCSKSSPLQANLLCKEPNVRCWSRGPGVLSNHVCWVVKAERSLMRELN